MIGGASRKSSGLAPARRSARRYLQHALRDGTLGCKRGRCAGRDGLCEGDARRKAHGRRLRIDPAWLRPEGSAHRRNPTEHP